MKKIIIAFVFLFAGCLTYAQTTPAKTTATAKPATAAKPATVAKTTAVTAKPAATGLKKDGTPDMRLKENKIKAKTATTTGPVKKDGTPDMRYKANKKK